MNKLVLSAIDKINKGLARTSNFGKLTQELKNVKYNNAIDRVYNDIRANFAVLGLRDSGLGALQRRLTKEIIKAEGYTKPYQKVWAAQKAADKIGDEVLARYASKLGF